MGLGYGSTTIANLSGGSVTLYGATKYTQAQVQALIQNGTQNWTVASVPSELHVGDDILIYIYLPDSDIVGCVVSGKCGAINSSSSIQITNPKFIQMKGDTGVGVSSIVHYYYLSTSSTTQTGGSWGTNVPVYVSGRYYWTRQKITYTDGTIIDTTPVLDNGLTDANWNAHSASTTATNYITYINATDGIKVHNDSDTANYAQLNSNGMYVYKNSSKVAEFSDTVIIGEDDRSQMVIDNSSIRGVSFYGSDVFKIQTPVSDKPTDITEDSGVISPNGTTYTYTLNHTPTSEAVTMYGYIYKDQLDESLSNVITIEPVDFTDDSAITCEAASGTGDSYSASITRSGNRFTVQIDALGMTHAILYFKYKATLNSSAYYIFGIKDASSSLPGKYSFLSGHRVSATGDQAQAFGFQTSAAGSSSFVCGNSTEATGTASFAANYYTHAYGNYQSVFGKFNVDDNNNTYAFIVGNGTSSARQNAFSVDWSGNGVLGGKLTVGAAPTANLDVATKKYVDDNLDGLYYSANDTFSVTYTPFNGNIVSNNARFFIDVVVDYDLSNVSTVSVTAMTGILRGVNGIVDSINGTNLVSSSAYTIAANIKGKRHVVINVTKSSTFSNSTANTPVSFHANSLTLKFT